MGTGFSYVNKSDVYTKDLAMVASDMIVLLKTFFECHKEFQVSKLRGGLAVAALHPSDANFPESYMPS